MANATSTKNAREADIENLDVAPEFDKKAAKRAEKEARKAMKKAEGKGGGLVVKLVAVLLVASIFAAFWFNVFGVRDNYLMPVLQRIPVVNNLLPMTEEEDPYESMTQAELIATIESLRREVGEKEEQIQSLSDRSNILAGQVETLTQFRDQQAQFRADKEEFDRMIVGGGPIDFARFFERVDPENAAILYQDAIRREHHNRDFANYVSMIQAMEARSAADMLSRLIRSNPDLVASVLRSMDNRISGEVLSAMSAQDAALIVNRMYPEAPPTPPLLSSLITTPFAPDAPAGTVNDGAAGEDQTGDEDTEE
ncbi:MAG: hypothetical protein FWE29_03685 [Defluviitaleaceae bacterium]|nr:hypothetical protein [Defluviitaleaceae bacterium]